MLGLIKKIVGTKNERELKRIQPLVERISALEPQYEKLTNAELRAKTDQFKKRLQEATANLRAAVEEAQAQALAASGEEREQLKTQVDEIEKQLRQAESEALDEILPEAFAVVREASKRTIGLRHFDAQMIGGVVVGASADQVREDTKQASITMRLVPAAFHSHLILVFIFSPPREM